MVFNGAGNHIGYQGYQYKTSKYITTESYFLQHIKEVSPVCSDRYTARKILRMMDLDNEPQS
jgi:hypothetical protein